MLNQNLLLAGDDGYNLTKSLRFRSSASAYLNRTPSVQGSLTTWTWSAWVKLGDISTASRNYFMCRPSGSKYTAIYINNNILYLDFFDGSQLGLVKSANVLRDPSAWYHIVVVFDTTNATASNRIRQYINGVQVTSFNTTPVYPSQNATGVINTTGQHNISSDPSFGGSFIDGYLAEVNFIDGQALTPSSFGSTNALTGVWQPAKYTGTYGTNGFYLPFSDNSALTSGSNAGLGKDFSGNGNYWNTNNISITAGTTYDSMVDVPTVGLLASNYPVLNPISNSTYTLSYANLNVTTSNGSSYIPATIALPSTGMFYFEYLCQNGAGGNRRDAIGIVDFTSSRNYLAAMTNSVAYLSFNGEVTKGGTGVVATYSTFDNGDTVMLAFDCATGKVWFGKNGTWNGSPSAGTGNATTLTNNGSLAFSISNLSAAPDTTYSTAGAVNFGQRPFSYTPPTGFVALNTFNLPTSTIVKGNTVMDATTYTGVDGVAGTVTNAGSFKPDLVWIKSRAVARDNRLTNSVVGTGYNLSSNSTASEVTSSQYVTSFNSNGFSYGVAGDVSEGTMVGWQWKANGTGSSNTAGSITSTVSANPTAGFSIVTYTGNGTNNATVGHGLGVAPSMIILKSRTQTYNWDIYHKSLGITATLIFTTATTRNVNAFGTNNPTSSVFSVYTNYTNDNSQNYVAYCWSEIAGFSKFGSYTGNGSTDGPFVYTGFRPKFVMIKRSDSTGGWIMYDAARDSFNVTDLLLEAQSSSAEGSGSPFADIDLVSNGFKARGISSAINASGGTYIYMAFAESPFKNSLAR